MADVERLQQADKHIKTAKKMVKKSLTKWSVSFSDYDQAAQEWEKAAKIYQFARKALAACDAWKDCAEMHLKADNILFAGRAYDSIAMIYKDNKEHAKEASAILQAGTYYLQDGKPEKYAEAYVRAARVYKELGTEHTDQVCKLLSTALDTLADAEFWHEMPGPGRELVSARVKGQDYVGGIEACKRCMRHYGELEQPHNINKCGLEIVVLCLAKVDGVLAERELEKFQDQHGRSEETNEGSGLIEAFDSGDEDLMKAATKRQIFTFLNPDIARLAKKLKPSGVAKKKPVVDATPEEVQAAIYEEDDELEGLR